MSNELEIVDLGQDDMASPANGWMELVVVDKRCIAVDVHLFELALPDRGQLPPCEPGSHITLLTPNGLTRRYSLCNGPGEGHVYRIAVKREAHGHGGSVSLVDGVQTGALLRVSSPQNYFPLVEGAESSLLIAGGIGITPILSMARALLQRGADFRIVYLARTGESAPFLDELSAPEFARRSVVHHTMGNPGRRFDLAGALQACPADAHIYCCGPRQLMDSVKELTRQRPGANIHFEDFGTSVATAAHHDAPFKVRLAQTGLTLDVPCGTTILEVLRKSGVLVPSSCESGTCGACRTKLVSGDVDHRDYVLDEDQHQSELMICVSRARSPVIEIDV